jgi:RimJ/RimL family protein N-acetyltransferase
MSDIVFRDGELVILRPLERGDVPTLRKWINNPEVTHFLLRALPAGEKEEEEFVESSSSRKGDVILGIVAKKEGKLIGIIGLHNIDHVHGHAVTGTIIGEREYWGKGYGTEAKMLLLDLAFNRLNLSVIRSDVIAYNGRSIAYAKKCGYRQVGRLPGWIERDGKRHDEVILVVTAKRWRPLWKAYIKNRNVS